MKLQVRVSVVGYRDYDDKQRFEIMGFGDAVEAKEFLQGLKATGGGDEPEDVVGALNVCLQQDWSESASKKVYFITDAPPHGKDYNDCKFDDYSEGD